MGSKLGSKWLREDEARALLAELPEDYSFEPFEYRNRQQLLTVTCAAHRMSYEQTVGTLIQGRIDCPRCRGGFLDTADFVSELEKIFPSGYDYSQVVYRGKTKPVTIICERHGSIEKTPQQLLMGRGCRSCSSGISFESFKNRADALYGEGRFDYSRVEYRIGTDRVLLGCEIHGGFYQVVSEFLRGHGCQKCGMDYATKFDGFLARALEVHGDRYGYDAERWDQETGRVGIHCSEHGWFEQHWWNHTSGNGCNDCANQSQRLDEHEIQRRLEAIHGDRYLLKSGTYSRINAPVTVICSEHGEQKAYCANLFGGSVARCCYIPAARSKVEIEFFEWLQGHRSTVEPSVRGLIGYDLEIDVYLPDLMLGIEFNGDYWHSEKFIREHMGMTASVKHYLKMKAAEENGIKLVYVWEKDWRESRPQVEDVVLRLIVDLRIDPTSKADPLLTKLTNG